MASYKEKAFKFSRQPCTHGYSSTYLCIDCVTAFLQSIALAERDECIKLALDAGNNDIAQAIRNRDSTD